MTIDPTNTVSHREFIEVEPDVYKSTDNLSAEDLDGAERLARQRGDLNDIRDIQKVRKYAPTGEDRV